MSIFIVHCIINNLVVLYLINVFFWTKPIRKIHNIIIQLEMENVLKAVCFIDFFVAYVSLICYNDPTYEEPAFIISLPISVAFCTITAISLYVVYKKMYNIHQAIKDKKEYL